jgi:hypothetical protein
VNTESQTIERLNAEIKRLQKAYDRAAGYYYCWGVVTMGIIFLAYHVIMP